ncbi:hypothetical protein BJX63DRAFT_418698 [Aspergillus granulosus]|uniref:Uncharacterized protein n=1 Tax=Aspergillus granulosus TaxID=176169 RepID=A0ABR4HW76_9EURO
MDFLRSTSSTPQSSSSELPYPEFSSFGSNSEDPLAQLASEVRQLQYTTNTGLQRRLEHRRQVLEQNQTQDQYLVFTSVPPAQFSKLVDERSRAWKYCRFSYNIETGILIARVMIRIAHIAAGVFDTIMGPKLTAMNVLGEIVSYRSTTVEAGNWEKGADCSWGPPGPNDSHSFVVEIGSSESARRLALDAHGWLENCPSVELVVTITVQHNHPEIILRRWERVPRAYNILTRASSRPAQHTAFVKISRTNNITSVTGASTTINGIATMIRQLVLPFNKVMKRPPRQAPEEDIVITEQDLEFLANTVWRMQGLL